MLKDEIISILKKYNYSINDDTVTRIETLLHSIRDENQIHGLDYIIEWFEKKRKESDMEVEEIDILGDPAHTRRGGHGQCRSRHEHPPLSASPHCSLNSDLL